MTSTTAIALLSLAPIFTSLVATTGFATDFHDGNVHSINYQIVFVDIQNGPGNTPTTVNVLPGADVSHVYMYGSSQLNVSGGQIAHVNAADLTTVTVTTATEISHLRAYDTSVMSINGVQGYGHVSALGSFASNGFDPAAGSSLVDVYGGTFWTAQAWASGILRFHDGNVSGVVARNSATIDVYGGNVSETVTALYGTVNVFGGSVASIWAVDPTSDGARLDERFPRRRVCSLSTNRKLEIALEIRLNQLLPRGPEIFELR
jgi:hypothetical protein